MVQVVVTFRALRSRNYRLFFTGQSISLIGTWMTRLATSWLVYRLTKSAFLLGVVGFTGQIPAFFFSPLAGVLVDRWNRHRTLVTTQALAMLQSAALATLALTGWINIWWIVGLTLFQGLVNTFETPARQSFIIDMIEDRADIGNAIALNSSIVNAGRLVGPAIAGVVIAAVGEGYCFLIDAISYLAVLYSLVVMKNLRPEIARIRKNVWGELTDGWRYITHSPPIRWILLMLSIVSLVGFPFTTLLPIVAGDVLHGGPNTLGLLTGATGVGALACAISLAMRKSVVGLTRGIVFASAMLGGSLIIVGFSRSLWLSIFVMAGAGFGMMRQVAGSNTILQVIVADDKRGRVMAYYAGAVFGFTPIGSLLEGTLAARIGVPATLIASGLLCILAALWFYRRLPEIRSVMRPLYIEMGIMQDPTIVEPQPGG